jgi:hypothetical protein
MDAMRLMSDEGVSSIAVLEASSGVLHSAVTVTDIGNVRKRHIYYNGADNEFTT